MSHGDLDCGRQRKDHRAPVLLLCVCACGFSSPAFLSHVPRVSSAMMSNGVAARRGSSSSGSGASPTAAACAAPSLRVGYIALIGRVQRFGARRLWPSFFLEIQK